MGLPNDLRNTQQVFTRTGLVLLGLDVVPLVLVVIILGLDGPRDVPAILIGGAVGEYGFLLGRSHVQRKVLAGDPVPRWLSAGGPKVRKHLLHRYSPVPTVLFTSPYFVAVTAYGLARLPWPPVQNWENVLAAGVVSAVAAAGLANAAQWMYFGWLVGRIGQPR